jgi:uncharacterized protein YozE (UPF0346 family)
MAMTFTTWLKAQARRDDPVGDLAKDMMQDSAWPTRASSYGRFRNHLTTKGACRDAHEALREAWREGLLARAESEAL